MNDFIELHDCFGEPFMVRIKAIDYVTNSDEATILTIGDKKDIKLLKTMNRLKI